MVAALVLLDDHSALGTLDENAKHKYSSNKSNNIQFKIQKRKARNGLASEERFAYALAIGENPRGDELIRVALGEPLLEDRTRRRRVVLRSAHEATHRTIHMQLTVQCSADSLHSTRHYRLLYTTVVLCTSTSTVKAQHLRWRAKISQVERGRRERSGRKGAIGCTRKRVCRCTRRAAAAPSSRGSAEDTADSGAAAGCSAHTRSINSYDNRK